MIEPWEGTKVLFPKDRIALAVYVWDADDRDSVMLTAGFHLAAIRAKERAEREAG